MKLFTIFSSQHTLFGSSNQGGLDEVEVREGHMVRRGRRRNMYRILVREFDVKKKIWRRDM